LQAAHIRAAGWADSVGQALVATLLAVNQVGNADGVVGAATIPAAFAYFALGLRSHNSFSFGTKFRQKCGWIYCESKTNKDTD